MLYALWLLAAPLFHFEDVRPWRWSEGRQERIPALSASLDNQSGDDWAEARFLVRVNCSNGGTREYNILLRDVLLGTQKVEVTAFDSIGVVEACEGTPEIDFVSGRKYDDDKRPSYILLGFSMQYGDDDPPSLHLEGILDYRHRSDSDSETHPHFWRDHGRRFELPSVPGVAFYGFRVEPGTLGLSGFLLNRDPASTGPLSRFLRFYSIPPGKVAYLGIFHVQRGPGQLSSVTQEAGDQVLNDLPVLDARPVIRSSPVRPGTTSSLTLGR